MDEITYDRQKTIPLWIPKHPVIVGVGGIGSYVALGLVLSGVPELHLFDMDLLEPSNFNRIPLPQNQAGRRKVEAMKAWLNELRPDCVIETYGSVNDFALSTVGADALFDATDNLEVQQHLHKWCEGEGVFYTRCGYNGGEHVTVMSRPAYWSSGSPTGRYEFAPSWAIPAMMAGALAAFRAEYDQQLDVSFNISDIKKLMEVNCAKPKGRESSNHS